MHSDYENYDRVFLYSNPYHFRSSLFCTAAPTVWNSPPSIIRLSQTLNTLQTTTLQPFCGSIDFVQVNWYQKGKTNLDLLEQEVVSGSGISWAISKSAPHPRKITMPAPHHSVFYRPDSLPAAQPTA